ncbi:MAG: glycosyltransferase [Propionibacteriales bacterium]|nr:glycosyltransferase [Propionibacteriales bacterium]
MRFQIVTPCWNAAEWIGETVRSVARQSVLQDPSVHIDYTVVDGASSDRTVEAAHEAWIEQPNASLRILSEPDQGMYDALVKGLRAGSGDVVAYINAGDYYSDQCLEVVRTCFERFGARWLTGTRTLYNAEGAVVASRVPFAYRRSLIRSGHYGPRGRGGSIQQESTFWSRELLDRVDLERLKSFRLAGDLFLWTQFAQHADLSIVAAHLGGFRFHGDHLSDAMDRYNAEADGFLLPPVRGGRFRAGMHEALSVLPVTPGPSRNIRSKIPGNYPLISWRQPEGDWVRLG